MTDKETIKSEIKSAGDIAFYAMQRIDLLIISVSGAGIYGCWEILKFIKTEKITVDLTLIKMAGVLFLSTIIINLIGQWTSYKANSKEEFIGRLKLDEVNQNNIGGHKEPISEAECLKNIYTYIVNKTNTISLIALFAGLILMSVFISRLF